MKKIGTLLTVLFLFFGCNKSVQKNNTTTPRKTTKLNLAARHDSYIHTDVYASKKIEDWKEYATLKDFINRFEHISPNEALNNAIELKGLIKNVKDSIRSKNLKTPAFKTRVNVLENEGLRLADMTYITAITPDEVNAQVAKILTIYGGMNEKINTIFSQKQFEDAIKVDGEFFGIDTLKADDSKELFEKSISKKSFKRIPERSIDKNIKNRKK